MNRSVPRALRRLFAVPLALLALLVTLPGRARAHVVYVSDFASGAGPEWSGGTTETAGNGVTFLGGFANEGARLSLGALPPHTYATVSFEVFAIGAWAGNGPENGPDVFTVRAVDGPTLVETGFSNTAARQGYPEAAPYSDYPARRDAYRSNTLGYPTPGDTTYRITRTFPHNGDRLEIDFAADGLSGSARWGLNAVRVTLTSRQPSSTLTNGDFELPAVLANVTYPTGTVFYGWTVDAGNVTLRKGWQTPSGEQVLDLSGSAQGAIRQDVPVAPGGQYLVRFRLSGNPTTEPAVKAVQVQWGTAAYHTFSFDATGRDPQDLGWEEKQFLAVAPSSGATVRLAFQAITGGGGGPLLDAVSVTPVRPGDVNLDGVTDLRDAVAAARLLSGLEGADPLAVARADAHPFAGTGSRRHGDGALTTDDIRAILRIAGGGLGYRDMAEAAVNDLYRHFWVGSATTGHILPTWGGRYNSSFPNGSMWERAQMLRTMMDLYRVNRDPALRTRIQSDWAWTVSHVGVNGMTRVGAGTNMNWSDDAGWSALMYLDVHELAGQSNALTYAAALFNNTYDRWADDIWGGGLWYTDEHLQKSVYQVSIILAGLRLYDITGEASYRDRAMSLYTWVVTHLGRGQGLYYVDYNRNGPAKNNAPPRQASSDTMLAGNMAMAVAAARIYRATGDDAYLQRAIQTADAILAVENDGGGVLLNDRDANVDGFYVGDWAAEVLTLPGIGPEHAEALRRTASSIAAAARTPDGYYSGNWSGPAQGPLAVWGADGNSFAPDQIVISANSVHMIVGAAAIGILQPAPARPFAGGGFVEPARADEVQLR